MSSDSTDDRNLHRDRPETETVGNDLETIELNPLAGGAAGTKGVPSQEGGGDRREGATPSQNND